MLTYEVIRLIKDADIIEHFDDGIRILTTDVYNGASSASFNKEVLNSYDIQFALAKDKARQPHKHMLVNKCLYKQKEKEMGEIVIDRVIFNDPVTVVMWHWSPVFLRSEVIPQKTVVYKQEGETFDPEKGLAMAFSKILFENKGSYYDQFKKWLPKEEAKKAVTDDHIEVYIDASKVTDALYSEPAKKRKVFGGRK